MEQVLAESQAFNLMIENYLNTRGEAAKNYQEKWDYSSSKLFVGVSRTRIIDSSPFVFKDRLLLVHLWGSFSKVFFYRLWCDITITKCLSEHYLDLAIAISRWFAEYNRRMLYILRSDEMNHLLESLLDDKLIDQQELIEKLMTEVRHN